MESSNILARKTSSPRVRFWVVFLFSVVVIYFVGIFPHAHILSQARQSRDMLRPLIASDPRFSDIQVAMSTNGAVIVHGSLHSAADLDSLKQLVERANPPRKPMIQVESPPTLQ